MWGEIQRALAAREYWKYGIQDSGLFTKTELSKKRWNRTYSVTTDMNNFPWQQSWNRTTMQCSDFSQCEHFHLVTHKKFLLHTDVQQHVRLTLRNGPSCMRPWVRDLYKDYSQIAPDLCNCRGLTCFHFYWWRLLIQKSGLSRNVAGSYCISFCYTWTPNHNLALFTIWHRFYFIIRLQYLL